MKILILSYNYHPEPIGIAPLITELAEGLVQRGHQVRVVTALPNYPERRIYAKYRGRLFHKEVLNGVHLVRHWVYIRPQPRLWTRLAFEASTLLLSTWAALMQPRADVTLTVSPQLSGSITARLLNLYKGIPFILNIQDLLPDAAIASGLLKSSLLISLFKALERFAYRHAKGIAVISAPFIVNLTHKGVAPGKLYQIPNWVDTRFIVPLDRQTPLRRQMGLTDAFVVMYSGNIGLTQGLETLIDCANLLRDDPKIQFVIVGEERALAQLRERIQHYGLTNVYTIPFQPRPQLPQMLASVDVNLILQKAHILDINMPSKTMLLMASARPVVASVNPKGEVAKIIHESACGIIVQPEDPAQLAAALVALKNDPEECQLLGERGRNFACENFDREKVLSTYENLLQVAVNEKQATSRDVLANQPKEEDHVEKSVRSRRDDRPYQ
ncbi:MAG TPA: glycosyltransferase family 4 protein [Methylococcales bacterium]